MQAARGGGGEEKLRRLPAGRHGLSREFVSRNQQERLIAGTIAAVAERGFLDTSVGRIAAAAGVSRQTFYDSFSTKEECYLASYELFESHVLESVGEAAADGKGWAGKVRGRVGVLLELLDANPDLVRFSLVAPPAAGGEILDRKRRFLERLVGALVEGAPKSTPSTPDALKLEATAGSLGSMLANSVEEDDAAELVELHPELVELVLAPFLGRGRAAGEARKP